MQHNTELRSKLIIGSSNKLCQAKRCVAGGYIRIEWADLTYLRVLSTNTCSSPIWSSENDWHRYLASRHIVRFCSRINDVVNRLQKNPE